MSGDNTVLNRNYIEMTCNQIRMQSTRMDVRTTMSGDITLDDFNLRGTMNTRLQSSIFNQFDEDLLNSKNSKCQADTYGAVYGPTYGDNLGTINCRGAFIGTETTGFIGSTFNAKNDVVSQNELRMNSLVRNQTVSAELSEEQVIKNAQNNMAIPMNMSWFEPNLANFDVVSYNTTGNVGYEKTVDSYFGNLWTITKNGKSENNPTIGNSLNMDLEAITQINISKINGIFNVQGNLKLKNYQVSYNFTEIDLQPVEFNGASTFAFTNGNVLVNGIVRPFSNALLANSLQTNLTNQTANLAGNFQFNSNILYPGNATPEIININGNISNIGSGNFIEWPRVNDTFPNIGNANIDFPKSILSEARFGNINANIVYFQNNIMNNSNAYYNTLDPPQYGTFIENIYNNMAIYNDPNASFIADNFIYINPSNANNNNGSQPNLFYGWNLKSSATINRNVNDAELPDPSSLVYLATGTDTLSLYDNNTTYLVMGPIKATDFNKQYFYRQHLYCEALFGSSGTPYSGEFRVYRVESPNIVAQNDLVSQVLLSNPTSTNSVIININNNTNQWITVDTSTNNNLFVHNTLSNTNYVYYVIRFWNYSNTTCVLRNLRIIQQPLPDYTISSYDIINNLTLQKLTAEVYSGYFVPFTLQYTYDLTGNQIISGSGNTIQIYGKIQDRPNLDLFAYIHIENGVIQGDISQISIYGNEIISNLNVSGVFATSGDDNNFNSEGNIIINSNVNYWDGNFYKYAWHANLLNSAVETLPPITPTLIESSPFSGLNGKLILQCGTANNYNETTKEYTEQPLYDNQISIMTWYFTPEKSASNPLSARDFTIRFKYQLFSEIRGDFFYFQYSPDLGRNYYNLIRQSGDIKSVKSIALFTTSLWKQAEFYLPGGNTTQYIFRWVYAKDLRVSNGFDIVYLADLGVNYTAPVLVDNNGFTTNYSNEFVGNITTGGSVDSSTPSYNLPFPIGNPSAKTGFVLNNINYGGNIMYNYNWGTNRNNQAMYLLLNTYYREDQNPNVYPQKSDIQFYKMEDNNGFNGQFTDKVWRLYDINTLKTTLGAPINYPGQTSWLNVNASPGFYNGTDMALMSSKPNNQDTNADNGLTNGEATYLTLGPFEQSDSGDFADLTTKEHNLQFKYLPDTENGYDLTGVITYDYSSSGDDETIRNTLVKLLTFNSSYHITEYNLNLWFNTNNLITIENIRYYPGNEGIYNSQTPVNGWINFAATIPPVASGNKRIYVIFFAKDWLTGGYNNDVVLIHDIRFTFSTPSRVILDNNGYLHGTDSGSFRIKSVSAEDNEIVIELPGGIIKTITLS